MSIIKTIAVWTEANYLLLITIHAMYSFMAAVTSNAIFIYF